MTTAEVTERVGALTMFSWHQADLCQVQKVLVDGAYRGEAFAGAMKELVGAYLAVVQRHQLHAFAVLPKRWVVERSFAWLEKCPRLWKNCD